tara:strand:+ start:967 stop:1662 length:696 start_codon:yes stop_codon:yes gene_type:complete
MNIVLFNPNTTESMTARMHGAAAPMVGRGTSLIPLTAAKGMPSIEGYYDEVFVVPPMIEALTPMAGEIDGVVVGCFDDTGVDALRAFLDVPVVGICQAAMYAASMISTGFSVVTTLRRSVAIIEDLAIRYGMERNCRRVRAAEIPVLALEEEGGEAREKIKAEILRALKDDGCEVVILGCAGMADLMAWLTKETGVPIIDGVAAGVKIVEALVGAGITTSKIGAYAPPRLK